MVSLLWKLVETVNTMTKVVIVCEDDFGLEVYSILKAINVECEKAKRELKYDIIGFISDNVNPFGNIPSPLKFVGNIKSWKPVDGEKCVLGIKNPQSKRKAVKMLKSSDTEFISVVAPWVRGPIGIEMGEGVILSAYSCANGVHLGDFVTLVGCMVSGHNIGSYSSIMRFTNIAGTVGENVYVGNHVFLPLNKHIGDSSFIEDGSIITKTVKPNQVLTGVPARIVKAQQK